MSRRIIKKNLRKEEFALIDSMTPAMPTGMRKDVKELLIILDIFVD